MRNLYRAWKRFLILLWIALSALNMFAADPVSSRPFIAIWRDSAGFAGPFNRPSDAPPYLRIAIWNDGRILFAKDAKKWGHELSEGRIEPARVANLKKALEQSGVFELKGNCYLVPDAPVDCIMLDLGTKQQMLYWDEVESPRYGINVSPKPHHLEFKRCWKAVNELAIGAIPEQTQPHNERFSRPPASWRLKSPIQSE